MRRSTLLFEWEDLSWFPDVLRSGGLDYLRFLLSTFGLYRAAVPVLAALSCRHKSASFFDLCSGGGGPVSSVAQMLVQQTGTAVTYTLSDLYPNTAAWISIQSCTPGIHFVPEPVDFNHHPFSAGYVYTQFSALHHFSTEQVQQLLKRAATKKVPIALFDGGNRRWWMIPLVILIHLTGFLFLTPFIRPWRTSRFLFTYFIPLIPLYTIWDGCVSILRLHTASELQSCCPPMPGYQWKVDYLPVAGPVRMLYLTGEPIPEAQ